MARPVVWSIWTIWSGRSRRSPIFTCRNWFPALVEPSRALVRSRKLRVITRVRRALIEGGLRPAAKQSWRETVSNLGVCRPLVRAARPGGAQGKRVDQGRDDLPALFSPQV